MEILYITASNMSNQGGGTTHVVEFIRLLKKCGYGVKLIKRRGGNKTLIRFFFKIYLLFEIFITLGLYKIKRRVNIVYFRQSFLFFFPSLLSVIFKIPYIVEINGIIQKESKSNNLFLFLNNFFEKFSYKKSTIIVSNSEGLKNFLIKRFILDRRKFIVVGMGVNLKIFKPKKIKNKDKIVIGYSGSLQHWQGLDYLIKSFATVNKEYKNSQLTIIGPGPEEKKLKILAKKLGVSNQVNFLGQVKYESVSNYINTFDICINYLTKFKEKEYGPPTKVFEYMACEKAVIMSDMNSVTKYFDKDIIKTVEPENENSLAIGIIKLIRKPGKRKEMGLKGRKFVKNNYSWEKVNKPLLKILNNKKL
jgi:glycosyltransferase involved in cell wall biosynthesis